MSQTTYPTQPDAAVAGMLADLNPRKIVSGINEESSALQFGVGVRQGTADDEVLEMAANAILKGVTVHDHRPNSALAGAGAVEAGDTVAVLREGLIWVPVEQAVAAGAKAYVRHTSDGGSNTVKGKWRADNDGVAQVTTVTPTAANDTQYTLNVLVDGKLFTFQVTSDASATATEICDAFRAAMAANAAFTALITATGTATLILTAVAAQKGIPFQVTDGGPGVLAVAETTPASKRADEAVGCVFRSSTSGAGLARLEVNLPG